LYNKTAAITSNYKHPKITEWKIVRIAPLLQSPSLKIFSGVPRVGRVERRLPIVIELLERGEYSDELLRSEEEYGDKGYCSEG
jgi:hypothetical protein